MTNERMIELLEREHECMLRKSHDMCGSNCRECGMIQDEYELHEMYTDIISLLKAQEPVKPIPDTSYGARPWWFVCGNCKLSVNEDQKYCPNCGKAVKWNA